MFIKYVIYNFISYWFLNSLQQSIQHIQGHVHSHWQHFLLSIEAAFLYSSFGPFFYGFPPFLPVSWPFLHFQRFRNNPKWQPKVSVNVNRQKRRCTGLPSCGCCWHIYKLYFQNIFVLTPHIPHLAPHQEFKRAGG